MRPDYGLDAPEVVRNLAGVGIVAFTLGYLADTICLPSYPQAASFLRAWGLGMGTSFLISAVLMIAASRWVKPRLSTRFLGTFPWRGDERVLDVGCGHGILLIGAAKRLKTGKAIGIDRWLSRDQADNRANATLRNAILEGVEDRTRLVSGDAQQLPFADGTFDIVVSSLVVHNIEKRAGRDQAVREMVRVAKPGGRIAILDIWHTKQYLEVLRGEQLVDTRRSLGTICFGYPAHWVLARKAEASETMTA